MSQPFVAVDACVAKRCILIATERKDGLIHSFCVENLQADEQVEIADCQASNSLEQVRLKFRDHILKSVFAEIGEIHKGWNASGKLDQLLLNELSLRFVFPLFVAQLLLLRF